jgi:hypothetical protein
MDGFPSPILRQSRDSSSMYLGTWIHLVSIEQQASGFRHQHHPTQAPCGRPAIGNCMMMVIMFSVTGTGHRGSAGTVVSTTALAIREWVSPVEHGGNGHFADNTACTNLGKTAIHNTYSEAVILAKSTLEKYGVSHMGRLGGPGEPSHFFLGASRGIYLEGQRRAPPTAVQQRHLQTALPFWSATNPSSEMVIPTITFANSSSVSDYVDPLFQDLSPEWPPMG